MALFQQTLPTNKVLQLRQQGLTDNLITEELKRQGLSPEQIDAAISQADVSSSSGPQQDYGMSSQPGMDSGTGQDMPMTSQSAKSSSSEESNIYERIEEITEGIIDEKWDELIAEVKKIVEWKTKFEEKQTQIISELDKLKDDFKVLHQGVLGKLEDYDTQMKDVGTELKAVGKVFKEVIPEFVENVKELKHITKGVKK